MTAVHPASARTTTRPPATSVAALALAWGSRTAAKLIWWQETEALVSGVAALGVLVLLLAPATRRHVG